MVYSVTFVHCYKLRVLANVLCVKCLHLFATPIIFELCTFYGTAYKLTPVFPEYSKVTLDITVSCHLFKHRSMNWNTV